VRSPRITIIIPAFNNIDVTLRALASLLACDVDIPIQVVVADDASTDGTIEILARLPGVEIVRNGRNRGFVDGCNRGAALARAWSILFLNNDTELAPGALRTLEARLASDDSVGIVGSKLVYPDGRLQEAGGIIWSDAGGWNFGRLDRPDRPQYNFARDVDYVSGASLLVRTDLFRELGGFDERFAPGYYEDADLCFAVRQRGFRVVYEPRSVVTHYEGMTSGTDESAGMKRFQPINKSKFFEKWEDVLELDHVLPDPANVSRAARLRGGEQRAVLVVDSYVPLYDREAGSNRLQHLIAGLREAKFRIVFFPDNALAMQPYTGDLQVNGIEVAYRVQNEHRSWQEQFVENLASVDLVWICRPELCKKYLPLVRAHANLPVVYDTIDLHHVRIRRQAELEGRFADDEWKRLEALELSCAFAADGTVVVSEAERELLCERGISPVCVVPTVHDPELEPSGGFEQSRGLLFIGGFNHTPNVDAALWLVKEIMPRVWEEIPGVPVTLLGSDPSPEVRNLASPCVFVPGFIHDVSPHFRSARMFVAPLRFGAGVKGKIGHALSFGLPIVTTPIGAEGFAIVNDVSGLVATSADDFAEAIVRLYHDSRLWNRLSAASTSVLEPFRSTTVIRTAQSFIDKLISLPT
jgi:GT2 family glycosyltransferase/glycosyltransferase involved in cell wall biosynthesis